MRSLLTNAQWFEDYPRCRACDRVAAGVLHSDRNANLGAFCRRCAEKAIKDSHKSGKFLPDRAVS